MARQFSKPYELPSRLIVANRAGSAAFTPSANQYVNMKFADKMYLECLIVQANVAPITLTPMQAQDVNGTGAKALSLPAPVWVQDTAATSDTYVKQANASSYTTDATLATKLVIFEIEPGSCMDVANGFRTISIGIGSSDASNVVSVIAHISTSYPQAVPPSSFAA